MTKGNEIGHPSEAHISLLPQNQPLPAPPSGGLQLPNAEPLPIADWPDAINAVPKNRREGSVTKVRLSHETAEEQLERSVNTKQEEIPDLATPEPHPQPRLVPPASIQEQAQSILYFSCVVAPGLSSLDDLSANQMIPDEQTGSG